MSLRRWMRRGGAGLAALTLALGVSVVARSASSPDWIVFSAHPNGAGVLQLYRVHSTGAGLQQITTGALPAVAPSFARSGTTIAFSRLGSGIFTANLNGKGLRRLTSNGRDSYPVWSPDGKQIAFIRLVGVQWRIFTMSASGAGLRRLPQAPPAGRPSWTPDGKGIIIPSAGDLIRIDPTTGRIVKYEGLTIDTQTGQTAAVSPNGRMVAYVGPRISTGPPDCGEGRCPQFALYLANVRPPHRPRRIANDAGAAGWSPDGKRLAFFAKGVLTLRAVSSGAQTTIPTGANIGTGDAPPAWR